MNNAFIMDLLDRTIKLDYQITAFNNVQITTIFVQFVHEFVVGVVPNANDDAACVTASLQYSVLTGVTSPFFNFFNTAEVGSIQILSQNVPIGNNPDCTGTLS